MKKLFFIALCMLSLAALRSCGKTDDPTPKKPAGYPETGPVADGRISIDRETGTAIRFAYCMILGSCTDDPQSDEAEYINEFALFAESMFLRPDHGSYSQWPAEARLRYYHKVDTQTGETETERIDISLAQAPFDTMNLSIETAGGRMNMSEDIAEVIELTRRDGQKHIYEPWRYDPEYGFWSEYRDIELAVHLRLTDGHTVKIECRGEVLDIMLY